jgi:hypothetical protein
MLRYLAESPPSSENSDDDDEFGFRGYSRRKDYYWFEHGIMCSDSDDSDFFDALEDYY